MSASKFRCREHPDQPVTPKGTGCHVCDTQHSGRAADRREARRRYAETEDQRPYALTVGPVPQTTRWRDR